MSCGLDEVMHIFNLLTVHSADTQVSVAIAGSLWYTKDPLCLSQRWPSLCPYGILETRVVLSLPFRSNHLIFVVRDYSQVTGTSPLALLA